MPYMLAEENVYIFYPVFICGNLCEENKRTVAYNKAHNIQTYSTKVEPVENQWCYNGCIQSWPLNHVPVLFTCQSNNLSQFYTDLTIWLNLIPICTELVDVLLVNLFFQLFLGTRFIQKSHKIMIFVLHTKKKIIQLEIRKFFRLSAFYLISFNIMVGYKVKTRASVYLNNLGWRRGCVFVGGLCVWGDGYICIYQYIGKGSISHFATFCMLLICIIGFSIICQKINQTFR